MENAHIELGVPPKKLRAAVYVRMSTDHQKYSIENQMVAINKYAEDNNISLIKTFSDPGVSGLTFEKRNGLKGLIEAVQSERADFDVILVLDVSRWGRFQDVDESAYYEYMCRRAGIEVHYVAEQFQNDHLPLSAILKAIKRAMAGEYSRELSAKVVASKRRLAEKGFRSDGAPAGFGLRRAAVDQQGRLRCILNSPDRKQVRGDRVILVPGPKKEVQLVNQIYKYFAEHGLSQLEIARLLNAKGIKADQGRAWTYHVVHEILTHEKYIGHHFFNKRQCRLGKQTYNRKEQWGKVYNAFEPIVPESLYRKVQKKFASQCHNMTNQEMLNALLNLQKSKGKLTYDIIAESHHVVPSVSTYVSRFGSLVNAYNLIEYKTGRNHQQYKLKDSLGKIADDAEEAILKRLREENIPVQQWNNRWKLFRIGEKIVISVVVCSSSIKRWKQTAHPIWTKHCQVRRVSDFIAVVCTNIENTLPEKYFLIPSSKIITDRIQFPRMMGFDINEYQYMSREDLCSALCRLYFKDEATNPRLSSP